MLEVKRQELKYLPGIVKCIEIEGDLQRIMSPDSHSLDGYYLVRSLYFDSLNNIDFWQKMSGDEVRKKIRIRVYSPQDTSAKLEMKQKVGSYQRKISLIISKEDALRLINENFEALLNYKEEAALLFYNVMTDGNYRPVSIIEYDRRAFVFEEYNNRVTIDRNVRFCEDVYDIFDPDLNLIPAECDESILEVKYDGFIYEPVRKILKKYNLTNVSVSKYIAGRLIY